MREQEASTQRHILPGGESAYEMQPRRERLSRQRRASGTNADITLSGKATTAVMRHDDFGEGSMRRSNTTGRRVAEGLKRGFGSLRRRQNKTADDKIA